MQTSNIPSKQGAPVLYTLCLQAQAWRSVSQETSNTVTTHAGDAAANDEIDIAAAQWHEAPRDMSCNLAENQAM